MRLLYPIYCFGLARDRARRKRVPIELVRWEPNAGSACPGPIELRSMGTPSLAQTTSYSGFSLHSQGETAVGLYISRSHRPLYPVLIMGLVAFTPCCCLQNNRTGRGCYRWSMAAVASSQTLRVFALCAAGELDSTNVRGRCAVMRLTQSADRMIGRAMLHQHSKLAR